MKVFIVSLLRSQDRRKNIAEELNKQKIPFEFFDAIDGREGEHELWANYNLAKRIWLTSGRPPSRGELGCFASHYLLWERCVELDEPILIIEDDSEIQPEFGQHFEQLQQSVLKYGFLRLEHENNECTLYPVEQGEAFSISYMDANYRGTVSYTLTPSIANKLLAHAKRWYSPVDNYIGSAFVHGVVSYKYQPEIVKNTEDFASTIQHDDPDKAPLYIKPTRELYALYQRIKHWNTNRKILKQLFG
ncbi:glycosyltransferase family 25 protein [Vibrio sp. ZSDZ34]|uniref:Glycosyltransferase family 25 protein n=1 Tax=Vibrio gelatinilyticus TaxID=2893468 RepID=A0A9X1WCY0_9VIBR|nr:glycosyltransferase family 25 protein [Vibrio gelatinilyticus]MCJ2378617.1 glycosyltransferase family 25 protein [Vibrio gelatinilyticus]